MGSCGWERGASTDVEGGARNKVRMLTYLRPPPGLPKMRWGWALEIGSVRRAAIVCSKAQPSPTASPDLGVVGHEVVVMGALGAAGPGLSGWVVLESSFRQEKAPLP